MLSNQWRHAARRNEFLSMPSGISVTPRGILEYSSQDNDKMQIKNLRKTHYTKMFYVLDDISKKKKNTDTFRIRGRNESENLLFFLLRL